MGKQEVFMILKKYKKWMAVNDIKNVIDTSKASIQRAVSKLNNDYPESVKKKKVKIGQYNIAYYKYIEK